MAGGKTAQLLITPCPCRRQTSAIAGQALNRRAPQAVPNAHPVTRGAQDLNRLPHPGGGAARTPPAGRSPAAGRARCNTIDMYFPRDAPGSGGKAAAPAAGPASRSSSPERLPGHRPQGPAPAARRGAACQTEETGAHYAALERRGADAQARLSVEAAAARCAPALPRSRLPRAARLAGLRARAGPSGRRGPAAAGDRRGPHRRGRSCAPRERLRLRLQRPGWQASGPAGRARCRRQREAAAQDAAGAARAEAEAARAEADGQRARAEDLQRQLSAARCRRAWRRAARGTCRARRGAFARVGGSSGGIAGARRALLGPGVYHEPVQTAHTFCSVALPVLVQGPAARLGCA